MHRLLARHRIAVLFVLAGSFTALSAQRSMLVPPVEACRQAADESTEFEATPALLLRPLRMDSRQERRGVFVASFATYNHHTGKGNYNSQPAFRALEWESPARWSIGGASFRNSFRQPCWYAFAGQRFTLKHRSGRFFAKVTAGVVYGYKPPHADAVPLNLRGYCPAIIPSLGYQYKQVNFQLAVFGRAWGAMPIVGCELR